MARRHRPVLQAQLAARGLGPYARTVNPQGCPPKSSDPVPHWSQTIQQVVASYPSPSMDTSTVDHITDLAYQLLYPNAPFPIPQNWQNNPNCEAWVKTWGAIRYYVIRLISGAGRRSPRHPSLPPDIPPPPSLPSPARTEWSLPYETIQR